MYDGSSCKRREYYDDEELDVFRGGRLTNIQTKRLEEFATILYTMQPHEVKGWNRSLILREINLPNQIKDELITMIEG